MRKLFFSLFLLPVLASAQPFRLADLSATDVSCAGSLDGALQIGLIQGVPPASFQWTRLPNAPSGSGTLNSSTPVAAIDDLPPGAYRVTVTDATGHDTLLFAIIGEPFPLSGTLEVQSDYNQYAVSCADGADGLAKANIQGGTPYYVYHWSGGQENDPVADSLPSGLIELTVTDSRGCSIVLNAALDAPPPLQSTVEAVGEKCYGENTGAINVQQIQGGVPPYLIRFDAGAFSTQTSWSDLPPGQHFITVEDANGCQTAEAAVLPLGFQFEFDAGPDTTLLAGDSLQVLLSAEKPLDTVLWSPSASVLAYSPTSATLFPVFYTRYQLVAIDTNGCKAVDEVVVAVHRDRQVYAPNVFAPEGQSADNRAFTLYGGGGIRYVAVFQVFDRFGQLIFEKEKVPLNDPAQGWQGVVNGEIGQPGVYVWHAVVAFTDGREEIYQGDVLLMR